MKGSLGTRPDVPINVDCPRRDPVLACRRCSPVERPEPPGEALVPSEFGTIQVGGPPRSGVDLDLHGLNLGALSGSHDRVTVLPARDFGGADLSLPLLTVLKVQTVWPSRGCSRMVT